VLTQVETTIAGRPDEVHLVSTMIDNPWFVHRTAEQTMREPEACRRAAQERRSAGAGPNRQI
jgi:hypothetical protein